MFRLDGKRALVTGASGGIGAAIAEILHQQGAVVGISGTRKAVLEGLAAKWGERCHVLPANLGQPNAEIDLIAASESAMGGVDILVNNAGITKDMLALRLKDEDWDAVLNVNLSAAFRLSRGALRGMIKRRWGRIVNITSIVAATGNPGQANYCAAKAGMVGMSKALAHETAARGITVNCVAPGYIETPMTSALEESQKGVLRERIPAARLGMPRDVGYGVAYLVSEEANYVTGQILHINGGMAML